MAAILKTASRVCLLGKTAGPTNMAAANIFGFTFETMNAQCILL